MGLMTKKIIIGIVTTVVVGGGTIGGVLAYQNYQENKAEEARAFQQEEAGKEAEEAQQPEEEKSKEEDSKEEDSKEPTEQPSEEPAVEPTEQPSEEPVVEPTEQPTEDSTEPQFTFTDLSATMYAKSTVNVRNQPDTEGEKLGGLSRAQEVSVTGQCNETGWYRISYSGGEAYVSDNYLVSEKPVEEVVEQTTQNNFEYELYKVYDYGEYALFYYVFDDDGTRNRDLESQAHDEISRIVHERGWEKCIYYPDVIGTYAEGKIWSRTVMSEERHIEVYGTGYPDMSQY